MKYIYKSGFFQDNCFSGWCQVNILANFQKACLLDEKRFNIYLSKKKHLQIWVVFIQRREKKSRKKYPTF